MVGNLVEVVTSACDPEVASELRGEDLKQAKDLEQRIRRLAATLSESDSDSIERVRDIAEVHLEAEVSC